MKNQEAARLFDEIADALEIGGENPFRVNAYRKAARILRDLTEDIEVLAQEGRLRSIYGIGEGVAKKIEEFLETGMMSKHREVTKDLPLGLRELLKVPGLGPKTISLAHRELGVTDIAGLRQAIENGSLATLPGMGSKKVENIARGLRLLVKSQERIPLGIALPLVREIIEQLKEMPGVDQVSAAGSLRRMKETVGDLDILVCGEEGGEIVRRFTQLPRVTEVLACGDTKGSVIIDGRRSVDMNIRDEHGADEREQEASMEGGRQVDVRVVERNSFGAALQYFTGSKSHNIVLRTIARDKGLKVSEYGVFRGEHMIAGEVEEEVYRALGLPWIPPELREDRGEIEAARKGKLPKLIEQKDIKGDLHVHSRYSDGVATLEEIARAGQELGYQYIAICDHSQSVKFARGLSPEKLQKQMEEIDRINSKLRGFRLLKGNEVDILKGGSLDYPDEILEQLDFVIAAIHQGFRTRVTERMVAAMENPYVDAIAHPTGRLLSGREGYQVDVERIMATAAKTGTALEINAYYDRLDLSDVYCRRAMDMGVRFSIGTDSHNLGMLWMMELGVGVARRGWITAEQVLNTKTPVHLRKSSVR
jgi:DNA polymerase (family 10)